MSNRRLVPLNVVALPTLPVVGHRPGDLVYVEADGNVYVSDGSVWTVLGGAAGTYGSADFSTDFSLKTTDDLSEGGTNLYFTSARAVAATDGVYDPAGSATAAEFAANLYTDQSVAAFDPLPDQTGNAGRYLQTDGTSTLWSEVSTEASQFLVLTTAPSSPSVGACYFDTTLKTLQIYDGTSWSSAGGLGTTVDGGTSSSVYSTTSVLDGGTASAQ